MKINKYFNSLLFLIISCSFATTVIANDFRTDNSPIEIKDNWQYRWGDSSIDEKRKLIWLNDSLASNKWQSINSLSEIPERNNRKSIWIRTTFPNWEGHAPSLFIYKVDQIMEVYLGNEKIYQFGDFSSIDSIDFKGWAWHLIKLSPDYKNKILTFRIRSDYHGIGLQLPVLLGSSNYFLQSIIENNFKIMVIGIFILFIGLIMFLIRIFLIKFSLNYGLIIGVFFLAILIIVDNYLFQLFFDYPLLQFYANHIALYIQPVGIFLYIEHLIHIKYKQIAKIIWQVQLAVFLIAIVIEFFPRYTLLDMLDPFLIVLFINSIIAITIAFLSSLKGTLATKILFVGLIVFTLSGLLETALFFQASVNNQFALGLKIIPYGALFLVLFLGWIVIYKFLQTLKQKEIAQESIIESKNLVIESINREKKAKEYFSQKLIESQELERKRIASDLHDSIGQDLLVVKNLSLLGLQNETDIKQKDKYLNNISDTASQTIEEVRNISRNLHPYQLDKLGLKKSLQSIISKVAESSQINIISNIDKIDDLFFKEKEIHIYRILQECLNNIIKHSEADSVLMKISRLKNCMQILIEDNGKGIKTKKNSSEVVSIGFGISGIEERVRILNGKFEIKPTSGKGTKIFIKLPY